jgi:sulfatase maturation enzyme AslB (radical SAM superfamily)
MTHFVDQFKDDIRNSIAFPFPSEDEPIELILKLPGESCNLNCSYCYEKRQPSKSDGVIGRKTIEQLRKSLGQRPVSIGLHGGEPLLIGLKRMGELLSDLSELLNVRDVKLQTNGTKLDDKWIDLFCKSSIKPTIGISHDGPNELSAYRVDYRGLHSQSSSSHPLELLSAVGLKFGVICVVSNSNVEHPAKLIEFFSQYPGLSTINFVPCLDYSVQSLSQVKAGTSYRKIIPVTKEFLVGPLLHLNSMYF